MLLPILVETEISLTRCPIESPKTITCVVNQTLKSHYINYNFKFVFYSKFVCTVGTLASKR